MAKMENVPLLVTPAENAGKLTTWISAVLIQTHRKIKNDYPININMYIIQITLLKKCKKMKYVIFVLTVYLTDLLI